MLVFRIIATVLLGISELSMLFKNSAIFSESKLGYLIAWSVWGTLWRAFCIVALWIV